MWAFGPLHLIKRSLILPFQKKKKKEKKKEKKKRSLILGSFDLFNLCLNKLCYPWSELTKGTKLKSKYLFLISLSQNSKDTTYNLSYALFYIWSVNFCFALNLKVDTGEEVVFVCFIFYGRKKCCLLIIVIFSLTLGHMGLA